MFGIWLLMVTIGTLGCSQQQQGAGDSHDWKWWSWEEHPELGTGTVEFTVIPLETAYFKEFTPMGHLALPQHPIPTAAGGFQFNELLFTSEAQPIRAPARSVITNIRLSTNESAGFYKEDYSITLYHTNDFVSVFDHLSSIEPSILSKIPPIVAGENKVYVTVEAGDIIAKTGKEIAGLGWYLYDRTKHLSLIGEDKYGPLIYAAFPLDYFRNDLKAILYSYVPRTKEPRGGKIDFDIDGTISGNWIVEGSNPISGSEPWSVWLSFCYDMYDPDCRRISIGNSLARSKGESSGFLTCPKSGPAFTVVTPSYGPAIYKIYPVQEGDEFYGRPINDSNLFTLLVQMVNDRKIKIELFKGDIDNPTFTDKAMYYTR
jgi:hypothetical protein